MVIADREHGHKIHYQPSRSRPSSSPMCRTCGTDAYLSFAGFIPAGYTADGLALRPANVSYTCERCGGNYSQDVPNAWTPPGWQWYA